MRQVAAAKARGLGEGPQSGAPGPWEPVRALAKEQWFRWAQTPWEEQSAVSLVD